MLEKQVFTDALEAAITRVFPKRPGRPIGDDEPFATFGIDSLAQMNMLLELENALNLPTEDVELLEQNTPATLFRYLADLDAS